MLQVVEDFHKVGQPFEALLDLAWNAGVVLYRNSALDRYPPSLMAGLVQGIPRLDDHAMLASLHLEFQP